MHFFGNADENLQSLSKILMYLVSITLLPGLLSLLYIPSIVEVLFNTGKSSTPELAFQRYLRTLNNVIKWYGLKPSQRIKSLDFVRRTHAQVAKKENMTQYDMVITQWAFIG